MDILGVEVGGGVGWGAMLRFIATATAQYILLHLHTYVMLRCCTFSCISTHTSCYEPEQLAEPPNNKCQKSASNGKTLPTTAMGVCEALGRKPTKKSSSLARTQTLDRRWDWLKT